MRRVAARVEHASIAKGCSGLNATAVGQIAVDSWSFGRTTTYGESDAADCQLSKDAWIHQGPIHRFPVFPFVFFQYLARRLGCKRPKSYSQFSYGLRHTWRILNIIVCRTVDCIPAGCRPRPTVGFSTMLGSRNGT